MHIRFLYGPVPGSAWGGMGGNPVRDVMVGGRWVIGEGHHADEEAILHRYRRTMRRMLA